MRIVNRAEFLALPAGTFYAKGANCYFDELAIKGENKGDNDWWYRCLSTFSNAGSAEYVERFEAMRDHGAHFPVNEDWDHDGLYDADALFLIYEAADLRTLMHWVVITLAKIDPPKG